MRKTLFATLMAAVAASLLAGSARAQEDPVSVNTDPDEAFVAQGSSFSFNIIFTNRTAMPQTFQADAIVITPSGQTLPVGGPRTLNLGPNQEITIPRTLTVPRRAPTGLYDLEIRVLINGVVTDQDGVLVTVVPGTGAGSDEWMLQ